MGVSYRSVRQRRVRQKGASRRRVRNRKPNVVPVYTSAGIQFDIRGPDPIAGAQEGSQGACTNLWLFEVCYRIQAPVPPQRPVTPKRPVSFLRPVSLLSSVPTRRQGTWISSLLLDVVTPVAAEVFAPHSLDLICYFLANVLPFGHL